MSKKNRKRTKRSRTKVATRRQPGYRPAMLPERVDGEATFTRLMTLKPEALPSVGLAEVYLQSTPIRSSNQCVTASTVVMMALRQRGLLAEPVSLLLEAPDGRGGTTRARSGVRVIHCPLDGQSEALLRRGAVIPTRLLDGTNLQYHVSTLGSADALILPMLEREGAVEELALLVGNLLKMYTVLLSSVPPLLERSTDSRARGSPRSWST